MAANNMQNDSALNFLQFFMYKALTYFQSDIHYRHSRE